MCYKIRKKKSAKGKKFGRWSPKSKKKARPKDNDMKEGEPNSPERSEVGANSRLPNGIPESDKIDLKQTFELFDKNQDGRISSEELGCVLRTLGHDYTQIQVEDMIKNADINENGFVEYDEFITMMRRFSLNSTISPSQQKDRDEKTKEAFKVFDMDGNGFIDRHELKYVMRRLGENLSDDDVRAMFNEADSNGDGKIDFEGLQVEEAGVPRENHRAVIDIYQLPNVILPSNARERVSSTPSAIGMNISKRKTFPNFYFFKVQKSRAK